MLKARLFENNQRPNILCLGAHPDDIEIGCGGTILRLIEQVPEAKFYWTVFSGDRRRAKEACESAEIFLGKFKARKIDLLHFRESYFPFVGDRIKDYFEKLKERFSPDVVLTHYRNDAHQDHRLISALAWNTFRDNFILEYEIPKYDGDLRVPNFYVCLDESLIERKIINICTIFQTQKEKQWFDEKTFRSLLRLRGVECNSPSKYAEAFYCRKIVL